MNIVKRFLPSNCYSGITRQDTELIIVHHISAINIDPDFKYDLDLIMGIFRDYKVSAHYVIDRDGLIYNTVPEEKIAYHAGKSFWQGRNSCNKFSIGIELVGCHKESYTDSQYAALTDLCAQLMVKYKIPAGNIVGHRHVSPGRKFDPNKEFEWTRLRDPLNNIDIS